MARAPATLSGPAPAGGELLGLDRPQHRAGGAQDIHRMRGRGNLLQHGADRGRHAAERLQAAAVGLELGPVRQALVDEKMRDLLVGRIPREVGDVVAPVVEVVAALADGADRRVARDDARERDGFLDDGLSAFHGPAGVVF